ncbi:MAG: energy-coupling factor transporter transmembrane component T [Clostridiales bacterium]|nr:energy-coupling factor transporter transmembrane component T [Clostridiales bacterium]
MTGLIKQNKVTSSCFYRIHPYVSFLYFLVAMVLIMFSMHPVILVTGFLFSFVYSIVLGGRRQLLMNLKLLPVALLVCVINPLFNHQGVTILCYMNQNPITLESILFGLMSGLMIYDILLYFQIFHQIVTEDKLICIFAKFFPIGSLLLTMAFRFVPMYRKQYRNVQRAQKCIGQDDHSGNILTRIIHGVANISALITWCLENAIESSDSMKSRGFTLKGRTYYKNNRLTRLDKSYLIIELSMVVILVVGSILKVFYVNFFPVYHYANTNPYQMVFYVLWVVFCFLPYWMDKKEELAWHISKQKI